MLDNARARGVARLPQHLDPPERVGRRHRHRRAQRRRLGQRRRPSARGRRPSRPRRRGAGRGAAASQGHRDRRMRARLLLRQVRPRGAARAVRGAYRGGAGDRPAADRPHPRRRGGHRRDPRRGGAGRAASPACSTASPAAPSWRARRSTSASTSRCRASSPSRTPGTCRRRRRAFPLDRLLVETDSPFLAPVPHRGKTCEPAFVADTAAFVAELRGEEPDALAEATTANFFRLFSQGGAA